MMDIRRPMMLTGRVVLEDGTAPPEPAQLVLMCSGQARAHGYSGANGGFSVTLGQSGMQFADASIGDPNDNGSVKTAMGRPSAATQFLGGNAGMTERELMGCEFRVELPGFHANPISLAGRRVMDNPDVGIIVLRRLGDVQGFTFSATTTWAPKDARKEYGKGAELLKKSKPAEAEPRLRAAVAAYPKYALAWLDLGRALELQKKLPDAEKAYSSSAIADPKFLNPHLSLLQMALNKGDWPAIAERSDTVLKLNPYNYARVWYVNGAAHYNLKHVEQAEKSAREALRLDTDHQNPRAAQLLGTILSDKGDYTGALEQFRAYVALAPSAPDAERVKRQIAVLEQTASAKPARP